MGATSLSTSGVSPSRLPQPCEVGALAPTLFSLRTAQLSSPGLQRPRETEGMGRLGVTQGWQRKPSRYPSTNSTPTDPRPCSCARQVPSLIQARLGMWGQLNNISREISNCGMRFLQETFPVCMALLQRRNHGGSSRGPDTLVIPCAGPEWCGTLSPTPVPQRQDFSLPHISSWAFQLHPLSRSIKQQSNQCMDRQTRTE